MKFLLDTHVFLWLAASPSLVPAPVLAQLESIENSLFLSSISVWEIEQKFQSGKLLLHTPPESLVIELRRAYDIHPLPFDDGSAFLLEKLPRLHGDPFDRMLICQAIHGGMTIVTNDRRIHSYPLNVLW